MSKSPVTIQSIFPVNLCIGVEVHHCGVKIGEITQCVEVEGGFLITASLNDNDMSKAALALLNHGTDTGLAISAISVENIPSNKGIN